MMDDYIRQYGKRLYGLCMILCASSFDADDLYQETWLRAVDKYAQYDTAREFEPWLTRICVNLYRNRLRRFRRSPVFDGFRSSEEKEFAMGAVPEQEKTDYSSLYQAVDQLPEKLRTTVILFYFEDMDTETTAEVLGIPAGTVKSRLNKARKLLREVLTDEADL